MTAAAPAIRVLYLEDNPVDADLVRRELARMTQEVELDIVMTLGSALERLVPVPPAYDIVMSDLSLPDGSGLELLAHIRGRELPLAVVIITGSGDQDAAVAALKAGADNYLTKRADYISKLPLVLSSALASFQESCERRSRPLRVLYAEPNAFDFDLTRRYLGLHAPNVVLNVVCSGEEVLGQMPLTLAESEQSYDVLLLDYRLPGLNALEVLKIIRQERGLDIPIVLITGHGNEDVAVQALRLGGDDYLVKREGYLKQLPAILEKLQKQVALNRSEQRYHQLSQEFHWLLDAIPDGIILLDRKQNIVWANDAARKNMGKSADDLIDGCCYANLYDLQTPCENCPVLRSFETGTQISETAARPDGRIWDIRIVPLKNDQGTVTKVIKIKRDITEHRKLEEQLRHAQRMESIGTLAGGIAHDFNNILSIIIGYGEIFLMKMTGDDVNRQYITQILESAERASRLTQQLLLFSRKQATDKGPVDINDVISRVQKFLVRVIGDDITCQTSFYEGKLPVLADSYQLEQVLVNLATNARDAMPNGGTFSLTTESVTINENYASALGFGLPGDYALISVTDTGTGMDEVTRKQIFEPFFTTKEAGKGTGLGLAVTYGIIKQHDGFVNVYSEPDIGTTFKIYLPVILSEGLDIARDKLTEATVGGAETILLAEDDEMLRNMMVTILCDAGYTVIEAVDGVDAVSKFSESSAHVDMLMLDLIMPGKNGKEAFDAIRILRPGIKTLFTSGYAPEIIRAKVVVEEGIHIIAKPMSPQELLREIRSVLDDRLG